jgi:hypothetical protein
LEASCAHEVSRHDEGEDGGDVMLGERRPRIAKVCEPDVNDADRHGLIWT